METETAKVTPANVEVGMGATVYGWSDAMAYTVIEVRAAGRKLVLQRDKTTLLNGVNSGEPDALKFYPGGFMGHTSGVQRYAIEPNPLGATVVVTLRKDGKYRKVGDSATQRAVTVGVRNEHYDFNF